MCPKLRFFNIIMRLIVKFVIMLEKNFEKWITIMLLMLMVILIATQVVMRYFFQNSSTWTEELIRWFFVWFIWVGISYGFQQRNHIRVTLFVDLFSNKVKNIISIVVTIIMIAFFVRLIIIGWNQASSPIILKQASVAFSWPWSGNNVSMFWLYVSMPVGAALTSLRLMQNLFYDVVLFNEKHMQRNTQNALSH